MARGKKEKKTVPSLESNVVGKDIPFTCDRSCANYGKSLSLPENKPVWTAREFNKKVSKLANLQGDPTAID